MRVSIVMTYYQRQMQLLNTLESFRQYDYDFDVMIVDDCSPNDIQLPELPYKVTILKLKEKQWINPGVTFNIGFNEALKVNPDIIIIQNAECYHRGDIVGNALKNVTDENYITYACYSLSADQTIDLKDLNPKGASGNGDSAWYNHSVYRPEYLHFCSAITVNNLRKINGFDERFALGLGYEDNYLVHQINCLGLRKIIIDDPFVFHQYHYDIKAFKFDLDLYNRTGTYCRQLMAEKQYRSMHLITPDL